MTLPLAVLAMLAAQTSADAPAAPAAVPAPPSAAASTPDAATPAAPAPVLVPAPVASAAPAPAAAGPAQEPTKDGTKAPEDIVVSGRVAVPGDPLASVNAKSFAVVQSVDRAFVGPLAMGYKHGLPEPVRDGLHNFLANMREPVVFVNNLLQLKPGRAFRTLGRFAINSSLGVGGVFDMARRKPFRLEHDFSGFEDTFACWGIGAGPYLYLPLVGPTTVRDVIGVVLDRGFLPFTVGGFLKKPYYALPAAAIDTLDFRVAVDADLNRIRDESGDPYAAWRDLYLKQRYEHLVQLCPKHAAKAFRLPPSLKAELTTKAPPEPKAAATPQP